MITGSSFLPRLSLSRRDNGAGLPFYNPTSPPIRKKPSEYDLSELSPQPSRSPRAEDGLISPEPWRNRKSSSEHRSLSPNSIQSGRLSNTGSASKTKPNGRILFNGPPPPIATSRMFYRDEEETEPRRLDASTIARGIGSIFIDRSSPSHTRTTAGPRDYEPDTVWRTLQRRENTLQKELQRLLDAQSVGLAGNFGDGAQPDHGPHSAGASDAGSNTPTGTLYASAMSTAPSMSSSKHVVFAQANVDSSGKVIPVRQPRARPVSLPEARAGLARYITLLADLKAEEDATLASALSSRKKALAQLRKLSSQQKGIEEELHALEDDKEEPLAQELQELTEERDHVAGEIAELEERLVGLRNRKRWLDAKVDDVKNRREAGLSGYRGALKEVEGKVWGILRRPGVRPLDLEVIDGEGDDNPGGEEFLRLKPERRTAEMAKEWWEGEVALLERRKGVVDRDRKALEEGVEVWKAAVEILDQYEKNLDQDLKRNKDGKAVDKTPEEAVYGQLVKIRAVGKALEEKFKTAEKKGWNLLICAIGAELGAYKLADKLLSNTLKDMGVDIEKDKPEQEDLMDNNGDNTPHLGRSMKGSGALTLDNHRNGQGDGNLVDLHDDRDDRRTVEESDNEVPSDFLVSAASPKSISRESSLSENEVPPEFLVEHA
ncbi:hypothetical protein QBC38DRAFT_478089 [Podospora fimiseda]|uniref:Autophagy-related protein 28 n=1 Tax=Podospora fimiseda TaxID=252190 RepID=A0AAN7GYP5_9PEZI|nr:hypothetical protein QBC38DRAFT_478089 [Podospora fimiseda]